MSTAEATTSFDEATKTLGDKIVSLTLLQAKALADYKVMRFSYFGSMA